MLWTMSASIVAFEDTWRFVRGMTCEFIEVVPDEHWQCAPYPRAQPLHKQFRHMVWCAGAYNHGMRTRSADWTAKRSHYTGGLSRAELLEALRAKDAELMRILDELKRVDLDEWRVDFIGQSLPLERYLNVLLQHEALHHGMWSVYARLAVSRRHWAGG